VLQPFIPGKAGSLSLLCCDGRAQLLSCNEHRIAVRDNQLHFLGTTVNSMADSDGAFARLAQAVVAAVPGLWGHVGVEFVIGVRGVVVLGVNARITPAYAGLRASLGCNPAALVMDLLEHPLRIRPAAAAARPAAVAVSVDLGIDPGVDLGVDAGVDADIYPDIDRGDRQR
jgi:predicted ATP-grasp superfamily ATP-dependent carboligase